MGTLAVVIITAGLIIAGGMWLGNRVSSPRTKVLTRLISAHRFKDDAAKAQSIQDALEAFGISAEGPAEPILIDEMLQEAHAFDLRYGRFHWGVLAEKLLLEECLRRGLTDGAPQNEEGRPMDGPP